MNKELMILIIWFSLGIIFTIYDTACGIAWAGSAYFFKESYSHKTSNLSEEKND